MTHRYISKRDSARWAITDPGNGGALQNNRSGVVDIVTGGAETRTLANPVRAGIMLRLNLVTAVGACTITVASAYNAADDTDIVLTAAGDTILLESRKTESGFSWTTVASEIAA